MKYECCAIYVRMALYGISTSEIGGVSVVGAIYYVQACLNSYNNNGIKNCSLINLSVFSRSLMSKRKSKIEIVLNFFPR
jgi:hypothetical protein